MGSGDRSQIALSTLSHLAGLARSISMKWIFFFFFPGGRDSFLLDLVFHSCLPSLYPESVIHSKSCLVILQHLRETAAFQLLVFDLSLKRWGYCHGDDLITGHSRTNPWSVPGAHKMKKTTSFLVLWSPHMPLSKYIDIKMFACHKVGFIGIFHMVRHQESLWVWHGMLEAEQWPWLSEEQTSCSRSAVPLRPFLTHKC